MPQWDSKKFDERATEIAREFGAKHGSLHDLTVKTAKEHGLNEEQIRRLGRAVNVKTFEHKFAGLKGQPDRIVDFDPVDPEAAIQTLFHQAPVAEKQAAARYPDLDNQMRRVRGWGSTEKVASIDVQAEMRRSVPKDPPLASQINHWTKVAEELGVKIAGAEMRWDASMNTLLNHAKRLNWDRDEFEKDALALHGGDVLTELNAMRKSAKLEALRVNFEAAEKLASHLFGVETETTNLIKVAADARKTYQQASLARTIAREKVAELRKKALQ